MANFLFTFPFFMGKAGEKEPSAETRLVSAGLHCISFPLVGPKKGGMRVLAAISLRSGLDVGRERSKTNLNNAI